jgi:hypothetical protein
LKNSRNWGTSKKYTAKKRAKEKIAVRPVKKIACKKLPVKKITANRAKKIAGKK